MAGDSYIPSKLSGELDNANLISHLKPLCVYVRVCLSECVCVYLAHGKYTLYH